MSERTASCSCGQLSAIVVGEPLRISICHCLACQQRTGSVLSDAILGDDVLVEPHCVVAQSRLDNNTIIGPFARFRPGTHLKQRARAGNFVEMKNCLHRKFIIYKKKS